MGTWHCAVLTPSLHDSIILQPTANEVDRLFLPLLSKSSPPKATSFPEISKLLPTHFHPGAHGPQFSHSYLRNGAGFFGGKGINFNIMTKIVLRHLAFPHFFLLSKPTDLDFHPQEDNPLLSSLP